MSKSKLEEKFMVQWLYADDTQDTTNYMNREEVINRFKKTIPAVKNEDFEQCLLTIGIVSLKIVKL